jgi:hypothetical protein
LIAFVVACHGFTYIPFGLLVPDKIKGWRGSSRPLGTTLTGDRLRTVVLILHVLAGIAILACAAAIAFAPGWWWPLAIVGAALGIAAFAVFWDGQTRLVVLWSRKGELAWPRA